MSTFSKSSKWRSVVVASLFAAGLGMVMPKTGHAQWRPPVSVGRGNLRPMPHINNPTGIVRPVHPMLQSLPPAWRPPINYPQPDFAKRLQPPVVHGMPSTPPHVGRIPNGLRPGMTARRWNGKVSIQDVEEGGDQIGDFGQQGGDVAVDVGTGIYQGVVGGMMSGAGGGRQGIGEPAQGSGSPDEDEDDKRQPPEEVTGSFLNRNSPTNSARRLQDQVRKAMRFF